MVDANGVRVGHCDRCRTRCCACARPIDGGRVTHNGHVFCSVVCAESGSDCGAKPVTLEQSGHD